MIFYSWIEWWIPCNNTEVEIDGEWGIYFPDFELSDTVLAVEVLHGLFGEEGGDWLGESGEDFDAVGLLHV